MLEDYKIPKTDLTEKVPRLGHIWGLIWRAIVLYAVIASVVVFPYGWVISLDELTVKIRPSVASFIVALVVFLSLLINKKGLLSFLFGKRLMLPDVVWKTMNIGFILACLILGITNFVVALNYSTDEWVYYKTFGKDIVFFVLLFISSSYSVYSWKKLIQASLHRGNNA